MSEGNADMGHAFLEENKSKPGVVTLPSGLQYKVIYEGPGMDHPKVDTPCDCHYAGRLIDGTQFDSSFDRGKPSTFAPNQVIKGWTEAMQLMVQGDRWELYIPMELAYGPSGRPPTIPPAATLVFVMEIVKIQGPTVPKKMTFPEWTEEELSLWMEKDEAACQKWREDRSGKWEAGDAGLKEKYPTRDALDAWLDATCQNSKNKSLWKRTRLRARHCQEEGASQKKPPALTKDTARALLTKILDTVKEQSNKDMLEKLLKECEGADPAQAGMMKMMKLLPAVQTLLGPVLTEAGFKAEDLVSVSMQIQAFGAEDPTIAADTGMLMSAMQGDFSALLK